jgi:hypothetical protein
VLALLFAHLHTAGPSLDARDATTVLLPEGAGIKREREAYVMLRGAALVPH